MLMCYNEGNQLVAFQKRYFWPHVCFLKALDYFLSSSSCIFFKAVLLTTQVMSSTQIVLFLGFSLSSLLHLSLEKEKTKINLDLLTD